MFFYFVLFFIVLILAFFFKNKKSDIIIISLLLFFSMFRGEKVGIDTINYLSKFNPHEFDLSSSVQYDYEFTYLLFIKFIHAFNLSPRLLIYFFSILTFFFIVKASKRFNVSISLVCLFFVLFNFYILSLNIARQFTAASILLYAYSYLQYKDKRQFLFFIFVLFATTIHFSSILFTAIYFVKYINLNKWVVVVFIILFFLLCTFYLNNLIEALLNTTEAIKQYGQYRSQTEETYRSFSGQILQILELILYIIIYIEIQKDESNKSLANLFFVSILMIIFFSGIYGNIRRVLFSVSIINIICFALYFKQNRFSLKKIMIFLLIFIVFGYEVFYSLAHKGYGVVPYYLSF